MNYPKGYLVAIGGADKAEKDKGSEDHQ